MKQTETNRSVFIGLGSNLGDRCATIRQALRDLELSEHIRVLACSSFHETDPVGGPAGQGKYLNAAAELATDLLPAELLVEMQEVERRHGRERVVINGPRTLDLDLLVYRDAIINRAGLTVPHPRMWDRAFVMEPLAEICDVEALKTRLGIGRKTCSST